MAAGRFAKPKRGAVMNRGHWFSEMFSNSGHVVIFNEGGGLPRDYAQNRAIRVRSVSGAVPQWGQCSSVPGQASYAGGEGDPCVVSGFVDYFGNIQARQIQAVFTLTSSSAATEYFYGGQSVTTSAGTQTAAATKTAIETMTSVGSGNSTVSGPNGGPFLVNILPTASINPGFIGGLTNVAYCEETTPFCTYEVWFPENQQQLSFQGDTSAPYGPGGLNSGFTQIYLFKPLQYTSLGLFNPWRIGDTNKGLLGFLMNYNANNQIAFNGFATGNGGAFTQIFTTYSPGDWLWVIQSITHTSNTIWVNPHLSTTPITGSTSGFTYQLSNYWNLECLGSSGVQAFTKMYSLNSTVDGFNAAWPGGAKGRACPFPMLLSGHWMTPHHAITQAEINELGNIGPFANFGGRPMPVYFMFGSSGSTPFISEYTSDTAIGVSRRVVSY